MKKLKNEIREWLEVHKKNSVKPATYKRLLISAALMERYPISDMDTERLSDVSIQHYINELVSDGYAQTTIKKQFHLISGFVRYANATGLLPHPVYAAVNMPSQSAVKKPKRQINAYSSEEQTRLKAVLAMRKRAAYPIVSFMLETGLRVGETLALRWQDILWQKKALNVNKTLINMEGNTRMEVQLSPKSASSTRTIPLSSDAYRILESLPKASSFVFSSNPNKPFSYKELRYAVKKACEKARIPYYGMHVFRHTFATNCYYRGCDVKILSKLLGHSSVTVTYNTYIHLFGDALEEMRAVLG